MKLRYFSHSSFQITTDDGHVLLIDPFLDDNPKVAIPMHYNTFPVIEADLNEFKKQVETIGKKAIVLEFGQEIEL